MGFKFKDKVGYEPEEIYFRYYIRFADDWIPDADGGKMPGAAGTYEKAGWGAHPASGTTGWSMRGSFSRAMSLANPLHGKTVIGTYAYHAGNGGRIGEGLPWMETGRGLLERNRWYCVEQYFKVNTPHFHDGILRAWIDGELAIDRSDFRVRDAPSIKIQEIWMNIYHGGTQVATQDLHLYIDNVVIARKPIGCITR
jgi:hypothetical protein